MEGVITIFKLNDAEYEIVDLLWREGRPLTAAETLKLLPDKSWKDSTVHMHINSLLEKEIIAISGFIKAGKTYARQFEPAIASDRYLAMQLKESPVYKSDKNQTLTGVIADLISDDDISTDTLSRINKMIDKRKAEISTE